MSGREIMALCRPPKEHTSNPEPFDLEEFGNRYEAAMRKGLDEVFAKFESEAAAARREDLAYKSKFEALEAHESVQRLFRNQYPSAPPTAARDAITTMSTFHPEAVWQ